MRRVSRRRLASVVVRQLGQSPQSRRRIVQTLAAYLIVHKQQKHADLLLMDIAAELQRADAHLYAEVSSAFPLDATSRTELSDYLRLASGAKTVELSERVEPDLLAGVVVRTSDQELDTSARTKLHRLKGLNVNALQEARGE